MEATRKTQVRELKLTEDTRCDYSDGTEISQKWVLRFNMPKMKCDAILKLISGNIILKQMSPSNGHLEQRNCPKVVFIFPPCLPPSLLPSSFSPSSLPFFLLSLSFFPFLLCTPLRSRENFLTGNLKQELTEWKSYLGKSRCHLSYK